MTGDTTYGTTENIVALEDAGHPRLRSPARLRCTARRSSARATFTYDAERDEYRCPQGQPLPRRKTKYTEAEVRLPRRAGHLQRLPGQGRRAPASDHGRMIHRSFYADYLEKVRGYHATEAYQKAMRKRQVWVEPLFAEAKDWHGLRRLRLRGLLNANIQGLLIAAGRI